MKASYGWIREYVPAYRSAPAKMAEQLTFSGTEIEGVEKAGKDSVLEAAVTSNRADCLGHLGLAREVAAASGHALVPPPMTAEALGGRTADVASVEVQAPDLCSRFTARVIEGVRIGPSPEWLRTRLEAIGVRPVNNVVDVTNFVLFELNQPLHAFDLDRLPGGAIVVRRARAGEKLVAINGQACELVSDDLVIADRQRAVGIAGVMGGRDTEVGDGTTRILIESACFARESVRRTARRLQIASDASFRFERGVDRAQVLAASERAARLILEVAGGTLRSEPIDAGGPGPAPAPITLRLARVKAVAGISIPRPRVAAILRSIACAVEEGEEAFQVTPPTFRADLAREIDLIEEVIRLHGFDRVPLRTAMTARTVRPHPAREVRERVKDRMAALGFLETVTPDFVADATGGKVALLASGPALRVLNPVRAGEGTLRRSLLPSLLQVRKHNQDAGNDGLRLFEIANLHAGPGADAAAGTGPEQFSILGFLVDGDWRDARGAVESLAAAFGFPLQVASGEAADLDPGLRARLLSGDRLLGVLGRPSRELLKAAGLKVHPVYGEIDLRVVEAASVAVKRFTALPRFPAVERDLALKVAEDVPYASIESGVRAASPRHLESLALFDEVYRGAQVGEGRKSINIRLVFRAPDATLTAESVDEEIARVVRHLHETTGAETR